MTIKIRVRAKSSADDFREVSVADDGAWARCNCGGFDGVICSHIDAVLIAGERAMVHANDLALADRAVALVGGKITPPETWRGTWRRELKWRGIYPTGAVRRTYVRKGDRPVVAFTGQMGRGRDAMEQAARDNGWDVVKSASGNLDVLVAADPLAMSDKLAKARANAIPIVSPDEWAILMLDGVLPRAGTG